MSDECADSHIQGAPPVLVIVNATGENQSIIKLVGEIQGNASQPKGQQVFRIKPDKQLRATLTIFATMTGLWLLGVVALTLVPVNTGFRGSDSPVTFRYQATGATYAYRDATGQYTVYLRGLQRLAAL